MSVSNLKPVTRMHRRVALLVLISLITSATYTYAADAPSGRRIEEVIVTAERREASIQDTSISITAFTAEFLDDFGIRNQEDLQNYVPATTIQPYDATVRGVGRNFRALGGDPGVSTYMNGIYSEDLLTATAATFFDVERIEVLRGPREPCTAATPSAAPSTSSTRSRPTRPKAWSRPSSETSMPRSTTSLSPALWWTTRWPAG